MMAIAVAVRRPARYQTMKLRRVMGRLAALSLGVVSASVLMCLLQSAGSESEIYHSAPGA